jgi:C-terminal processing protease CtpA/Prc
MSFSKRFLVTLSVLGALASCAPNPRAQLNAFQRETDMKWLLSKVESQYAPLEYKEKLHNFKYEDLKDKYLSEAIKDQTNEEFYQLMMGLIAEFKDGHMSGSVTRSSLEGRSKVSFLGIAGHRKGEAFLVKSLSLTFRDDSDYPIKVGDEILEIDGEKLRSAVNKILVPSRNTGSDEGNFTALVNSLFTRSSLNFPVPSEKMVKLKLKRADKIHEVEVPWVTKDYVVFARELAEAAAKKAAANGKDIKQETEALMKIKFAELISIQKFMTEGLVKSILKEANSGSELMDLFYKKLAARTSIDTFEYQRSNAVEDVIELYSILGEKKSDLYSSTTTPLTELKKTRWVPENVLEVSAAKTFPAYIHTVVKNKKRVAVGYIRIDTFSPATDEATVLNEFKSTLKAFADYGENGVQRVVIDMMDNGGGSLRLGVRMAQLLSNEKIKLPSLTVRLNDNWLDSLQSSTLNAPTDANQQIALDLYKEAEALFMRGEKMSQLFSIEQLYPFKIVTNPDLQVVDRPLKFEMVALVNEMCASMCDIFASILKDNKMAKIIGKQTMGAGGNVTQHGLAPNSGMIVNITESLILSPNGDYLENNGVKPDISIETTESKDKKYDSAIKKAIDELTNIPVVES